MHPIPKSWQDKLAVITGASSGIGAATARRLAQQGMRVVLVARRLDRLAELSSQIRSNGGSAEVIQADLNDEEDRQRVFEKIDEKHGGADILVNNAGLGWYGYGEEMPWKLAQEMVEVNISAVVHLTLLFLKKMRERKFGHIINIGSISGSIPSQGVAVYGATKSFLDAFTTALYRETIGSPVSLSVVRAGPVATEFFNSAALRPAGYPVPAEKFSISAEAVAQRIWELLQKPKRVIYIPRLLAVTPWVEACFGWMIDRLGPLLLKRKKTLG